jgi:hypothetical protein
MRAFVGLALILFSVYSFARPKLPIVKGRGVADGAVGVMSGQHRLGRHSCHRLRAMFQPVAVAIFLMTLGWFGASGIVTADTARLFLIGLPAVLLGTWLGLKLYGKLDEAVFRMVVLVLLLVSGLTLLPSAFVSGN